MPSLGKETWFCRTQPRSVEWIVKQKWNGSDCAPFGLAQRGAAPLDSPPSPVARLQEEKTLLQPRPKGAGTPSASRVCFAGILARSTRYARGCGLRFRP
ncbi:Hypothetical protein PSEBR_m1612 [Pseudomonas brassicacearum subsp. brassicacearum NFM421]|uniref:Uncharacterized protein n=1 Tax=Pseudomonas brassicacearum (strain NFM421) TaxID=994484 RepID=F2KM73_PSEBN|nr:Hypothetical protein PSEBR_m1612 [Pseudomonas brassicacearum subsp. brassicacearum NFM421]